MASDPGKPALWAQQIDSALRDHIGAQADMPDLSAPDPADFAPVVRWVTRGLAPLIAELATLRGEDARAARDLTRAAAPEPDRLRQVILQQARLVFPYDRAFDAAHESALIFAAGNAAMIAEHFGDAQSYADYYAETNTDAMMALGERGIGAALADAVVTAFARADAGLYSATFPGAMLRGTITAYSAALGRTPRRELALALRDELTSALSGAQPE